MATVEELLVVIGSDVDKANDGIDSVNDRLDKLKDGFEKSKKTIDPFGDVMVGMFHRVGAGAADLVGGALKSLWDFFKGGVDMASEYEASMNRIQAITGATDKEMATLDATAVRLGETFGNASAKDAADALEILISRGMSAAQANKAVEGSLQLATAAQIGYKDAAVITSGILDAFKLNAEDSAKVTDTLAAASASSGVSIRDLGEAYEQAGTIAHQFGLTQEQTAAAFGLMSKANIEGSDAGTAFKSMLMALQNPSDKARELMDQYGISVYNADGSIKDFNQIIEEFQKLQVGAQVTMHASAEEMEKYQKQADSAKSKIAELGEENAAIAQRMADDQARLTKFEEEYAIKRTQAQEDYHDKVSQLQQDAGAKRLELAAALEQRLSELETNHAAKLEAIAQSGNDKRESIERDYGDKVADITSAHNAKIQDIEESFRSKNESAATAYHAKLESLEADHLDKLQSITTSANQKREDLQRNVGEKLADLEKAYQTKQADIVEVFAAKGVEAANKYQDALEKLEAAHTNKMAAIRANAANLEQDYQLDQLRSEQDYQNRLADMQRDFEAKQRSLADNFAAGNLDRQLGHEEKVADIQDKYGDKISDLQAQLAKARRSADRKALQQQIDDAIAARDKALADEDEDYQRANEQAQRRYDLQLKQQQDAYAAQIAEAEAKRQLEIQRDQEDYQRKQAALQAQLNAETQAYEQSRAVAQTAYQEQLADLQTQQAQAQAQAQEAYAAQQQAAQTAYERQLNDLQINVQRQTEAEQAAYAQRQEQAQAAYQQQQTTLEQQRTQALADAQADEQQRLVDAQTAHDRALIDLQTALDKQTQAEQAAYELQRTQTQTANAQRLADVQTNLDQQLQKLDDGYSKQEQRASEAYNRSFTELSTQVNRRSTEMQAEMEKNNLAITDQKTKLDGLNQTLSTQGEKLITITQEMSDTTKGVIFGSDGVRAFNTVVSEGLPFYEDMAHKVNAQGRAAELADAQLRGAAGASGEFESSLETLQLELGKDVLPEWTRLLREGTKTLNDLKPVIKDVNETYIKPFIGTIADFAKGFREAGDKTAYLKQKVEEYTPQIIAVLNDLVVKGAKAIGENAPSIGGALVTGLWSGVTKTMDEKRDPILYIFNHGLWQSIKDWWGIHSPSTKMADIGTNLIDGLKNGLFNGSGKVYDYMAELGMKAKDKLTEWRGAFEGVGDNLVQGVRTGMDRAWGGLRDFINQNASQLPEWFRNYFGIHSPSTLMADMVGQYIPEGIAVGITANVDSVRKAMQKVADATTDTSITANATTSILASTPAYNIPSGGGNSTPPTAPLIINIYPQGPILTSRDLIDEIRDGLKEDARRNGYAFSL